jgi:hypothetical protein
LSRIFYMHIIYFRPWDEMKLLYRKKTLELLETKLKETNMIYNEFLIKYTRIHVRPIIYKEKRKPHRFTEKFVLEEEMNLLYFFL